jgi:hypothetical protein
MRVFERRGEQWRVQTTGFSTGWNPERHGVEFRRLGDASSKFVPGQLVFIGGGNLETASAQDLCASLEAGIKKDGPTDNSRSILK